MKISDKRRFYFGLITIIFSIVWPFYLFNVFLETLFGAMSSIGNDVSSLALLGVNMTYSFYLLITLSIVLLVLGISFILDGIKKK